MQAIAAGLGGPAVAAVLAALCLNYKHFGGGLPDLLLMRAVRRAGKGTAARKEDKDAASARGGATARGVAASAAASPAVVAKAEVETETDVPVEAEMEVSTVRSPPSKWLPCLVDEDFAVAAAIVVEK